MKNVKYLLLLCIFTLLLTIPVNAETIDYKNIYLNHIKQDKEINEIFVYDLDKDNIPELFTYKYNEVNNKYLFIYEIFTIENGKPKKILTLEPDVKTPSKYISNPISYFTSNNSDGLYFKSNNIDVNNTIEYYKINYKKGDANASTTLLGSFKTTLYYNFGVNFTEEYYYNNKKVTESEFLEKLNINKSLSFIHVLYDDLNKEKRLDFAINMYKNNVANPTFYMGSFSTILYDSSLYTIYKKEEKPSVLLINGGIITKANPITENNVTYLPVRLVCNFINKDLIYNPKDNTITIDNISVNVKTGDILANNLKDKALVKNVNNNLYLSTDFFEKYLNFNISSNREYIDIIALEDKSISLKAKPIEEVEKIVKEKAEKKFKILENIQRKQDLGRYYTFYIKYKVMEESPFEYGIFIYYDKYTGVFYENFLNLSSDFNF